MTTVQMNYQPLIELVSNQEVDFVETIQILLDYVLISTLLEKNNATIFPLHHATHQLIELRNAIQACKTIANR